MKIKSIASICKKNKTIVIFDKRTSDGHIQQWIGDGSAMYPLAGLPYIDQDGIFTIFDVPEKDRNSWFFRVTEIPAGLSVADVCDDEERVESYNISIGYAGRNLKALQTSKGVVMIESRYISPLSDVLDVLEYYERKMPNGEIYIAAKAGWMLLSIIMPYDTINKDFVSRLEALTRECRKALQIKILEHATEEARKPRQYVFDGVLVDAETGEVLAEPEKPEESEEAEEPEGPEEAGEPEAESGTDQIT